MASDKLRRQIAFEAARLMYDRKESEYMRAKIRAARKFCRDWVKDSELPSNSEIREQVQQFARMFEGETRTLNLRDMRLEALRMMRLLAPYKPRLIGSVLTGHIRHGSDIDIHVFSDSTVPIEIVLEDEGLRFSIEQKQIVMGGEERIFTHIHVMDRFPMEFTVYAASQSNQVFMSSITGQAIERAGISELEELLVREYPDLALEDELDAAADKVDRFMVYRSLLLPLAGVQQSRQWHPEGDALYHSLQVFELARDELPYDEEFQLAALLHDVGKGIDPDDHVTAGLEALGDYITPRTRWLIEHHMEARALADCALGARARHRLEASEDFEELKLLAQCDKKGRVPGAQVCEVEEALDSIRELARMHG
ncbi:MAG: HD domain-containing protein [Planctomycetota bacterium]|nr:HD domain-containing protein [Planctomycetota bacterium]